MANRRSAVVAITALDINGNSVLSTFTAVSQIIYNFYEGTVNIVDATGSFFFGYAGVTTVMQVIANGVTNITIS